MADPVGGPCVAALLGEIPAVPDNATFSNISAKSWQPVLVVEEAGLPGENYRP